ncbi:cathepsin b [Stylonychia lemnae]|uniref:Cathepsin b n=1 Tax=Stylonychia lemnae TaxID=5949 RepID=A0A078A4Q0_STYLE|nr:cathepsin b [Stylonychia lemnae]|eukprot:CDW75739.1 cathepsin b [Stylonychia lemnae]
MLQILRFQLISSKKYSAPVCQEIIDDIKNKTDKWVPLELSENPFSGQSLKDTQQRFGIKNANRNPNFSGIFRNFGQSKKSFNLESLKVTSIPQSFDARDVWPDCIHATRDQGQCGSCYAFAAAGMMSDRVCIQTEGKIDFVLSTGDLVYCDMSNYGCDGGWMTNTLVYLTQVGIATEQCIGYDGYSSKCYDRCDDKSVEFKRYKCKKGSTKIMTDKLEIMRDLMENGPSIVAFQVYEDFQNYGGGTYEYTTGEFVVGHATKLIGWGFDRTGRLYWISQNQWGITWGGRNGYGYFQIYDGELGFASVVWSLLLLSVHFEKGLALDNHPVRDEIVEKIKVHAKSWKPMETGDNRLGDIPLEQFAMKLGRIPDISQITNKISQGVHDAFRFFNHRQSASSHHTVMSKKYMKLLQEQGGEIPKSFDSRQKWPDCMHPIRDQQLCGSCWAFASSSFLSDRFCIHSGGDINVLLAPQDLVSCNYENLGCSGGQLIGTINYLISEGITSETCMPYQNNDKACDFKCINKTESYTKYYCEKDSLTILSETEEIQLELMTNGPLMVGLTVYEDFPNYKEGVYEYITGSAVGGHAIKLIGWGTDENGTVHWICQNQWGADWGENGYVRIKSGQLGLDSMVMGCTPDIE